jgi:23S rRNA (guanine2445-N2)-methyltransferase / 23S rRNA (guanine2069-N7)-methyltransferase
MTATHTYFATCPKGVEPLLAAELRDLGATDIHEARAGVGFTGPLETGYRACLWSRLASRVLLTIATFPAPTPEALYDGVHALPWEEHLSSAETIAVDATSTNSAMTHTHFIALKVKDALVDRLRELTGERPDVSIERPDVRVNVSIRRDVASIAIDLSGESLHRRGYREPGVQVAAPLKESLAAAILLRADWPAVAAEGGAFVDPLCGSGTLPIEAALMAGDTAPGLMREHFGFLGWRKHDAALWARLLAEAKERRERGLATLPPIVGYDNDARSVGLARADAERAGVSGNVRFERRELADAYPPRGAEDGLVATNPPYGLRLGDVATLGGLYELLGRTLRERFDGWNAAVFTSEPDLAKQLGLRSKRWYPLYNGAVEAQVYTFDVTHAWYKAAVTPAPRGRTPGAEMLANRLRKDKAHLKKWARRTGVSCWRVYDADMPEYAVAIDLYATTACETWAHCAEYAPPATIEPERAEARLEDVVAMVP